MSHRVLCSSGCCFECDECSKKTGMSLLCADCLRRRDVCTSRNKKPPLGIKPKYVWKIQVRRERIKELIEAMQRYRKADRLLKEEWKDELVDLILEENDD